MRMVGEVSALGGTGVHPGPSLCCQELLFGVSGLSVLPLLIAVSDDSVMALEYCLDI